MNNFKSIILVWVGTPNFREGWTGWKNRAKIAKAVIFPGKSVAIVPVLSWEDRTPLFTYLFYQNYPFFY